jgi:riboflavin kinase/FMN adenylyltransferase
MKKGFILRGRVIKGLGRGKTLGFPTINLQPEKGRIPANGIYAVKCWHKQNEYLGAASIGSNPTFPDKGFSIEIYLFDFQGDLLEEEIKVSFMKKLRDEMAFNKVGDLIKKMRQDVQEAKEFFRRAD